MQYGIEFLVQSNISINSKQLLFYDTLCIPNIYFVGILFKLSLIRQKQFQKNKIFYIKKCCFDRKFASLLTPTDMMLNSNSVFDSYKHFI